MLLVVNFQQRNEDNIMWKTKSHSEPWSAVMMTVLVGRAQQRNRRLKEIGAIREHKNCNNYS